MIWINQLFFRQAVFLIFLLFLGFLSAQDITLNYKTQFNQSATGVYHQLQMADNWSEWKFIGQEKAVIDDEEDNAVILRTSGKKRNFYKKATSVYYQENLFGRLIDVYDQPFFDWQLQAKQDTINGFACQWATTHFRGRDYEACFSWEIPVSEGPWKFQGLPGLIVQVKSLDHYVQYTLVQIEPNANQDWVESAAKYADQNFREFGEFEELFIRVWDRRISQLRAENIDNQGSEHLRIETIEVIYPALSTGLGVEL
ncbi:MAG: GLPGLI family protein [Flavobacteriaceae bacterium]|nr:GLPGLI family protein [Flavobacteriaceae bacterium]